MTCDFYYDRDGKEMWMTREQIGRALGYEHPRKAISSIHTRNKNRLDACSVLLNMRTTDDKNYDMFFYSEKGVFDIIRHSDQPMADAFMDFVWDNFKAAYKRMAVAPIIQTNDGKLTVKRWYSMNSRFKISSPTGTHESYGRTAFARFQRHNGRTMFAPTTRVSL